MNCGPGSRFAALLLAMFAAAAAHAQTPAAAPPAAPAAEAPKPRPPLKLRLDEADLRALTPPAEAEKKSEDGLPTLGGKPSPALERKASDVVPKDPTPGL